MTCGFSTQSSKSFVQMPACVELALLPESFLSTNAPESLFGIDVVPAQCSLPRCPSFSFRKSLQSLSAVLVEFVCWDWGKTLKRFCPKRIFSSFFVLETVRWDSRGIGLKSLSTFTGTFLFLCETSKVSSVLWIPRTLCSALFIFWCSRYLDTAAFKYWRLVLWDVTSVWNMKKINKFKHWTNLFSVTLSTYLYTGYSSLLLLLNLDTLFFYAFFSCGSSHKVWEVLHSGMFYQLRFREIPH